MENEPEKRLEKATQNAYQHAMYLTVGIGALLLGVNVWFLLCLIFCRSKIACCLLDATSESMMLHKKENSVETDLMGLSTDSMHNLRYKNPFYVAFIQRNFRYLVTQPISRQFLIRFRLFKLKVSKSQSQNCKVSISKLDLWFYFSIHSFWILSFIRIRIFETSII